VCICVAVILLEGGTELDLKVLDPAETAEGQVKRLAGYMCFSTACMITLVYVIG